MLRTKDLPEGTKIYTQEWVMNDVLFGTPCHPSAAELGDVEPKAVAIVPNGEYPDIYVTLDDPLKLNADLELDTYWFLVGQVEFPDAKEAEALPNEV